MNRQIHYQYRIREFTQYDGKKRYAVQWRDDWFGTGIFLFSHWWTCCSRKDIFSRYKIDYMDSLNEAELYLDSVKKARLELELSKIKSVKTINVKEE